MFIMFAMNGMLQQWVVYFSVFLSIALMMTTVSVKESLAYYKLLFTQMETHELFYPNIHQESLHSFINC